jgi:CBS domain-containing protein
MGVGYDNIEHILSGSFSGWMLLSLCLLKFLSWALALSSGTSGGTLAPLFTFGGGVGALIGTLVAAALPVAGVDPRMAALVGMAAIFAGASQALLASVIFAFETTLQPFSLLPLLGGCSMAYLTCRMLMRNSIMTEKIARRGLPVIAEYSADLLASTLVRDYASPQVVSLRSLQTLGEVRQWIESGAPGSDHGGFPVLDEHNHLIGVVTQKDVTRSDRSPAAPIRELISRRPVLLWDDNTIRDAVDLMVREHIGRLPVMRRGANPELAGILTRSDLLAAYGARLQETQHRQRAIRVDLEALTRMRAAR